MTRSFGLDATSALEELRSYVKRFQDDDLNVDLARDCALKAWHLGDHVLIALGPNSRFTELWNFQKHVRRACPELGYLQDICTESKHGKITQYTPRIKTTRRHRGAFSRGFSRGFDISYLEIELCDGQAVMFLNVIERAVGFWADFFEEHGLA